jgi:hypothetical protein
VHKEAATGLSTALQVNRGCTHGADAGLNELHFIAHELHPAMLIVQ